MTPFGVVIGGDQPLDRLDPVHADQQQRAGAEQFAELAQQVGRAARHEIADGRAGEEAELGQAGDFAPAGRTGGRNRPRPGRPAAAGNPAAGRRRSVRDTRRRYRPGRRRPGAIASSSSGVLVSEPAPNSTTAVPGGMRWPISGAIRLSRRGLGAGRIIARQPGDRVEQLRPALVVEPARREPPGSARTGRRARRRETAVVSMSRARRTPVNCQRALGGKKLR